MADRAARSTPSPIASAVRTRSGRLAPYARLDVYTDYRIDATWRVFARVENVTNTRYQEVLNFGTTGRALYGGFNATW